MNTSIMAVGLGIGHPNRSKPTRRHSRSTGNGDRIEKGMIMQQLNLITGKTKTDIAIEFIQTHEPSEGYFLGFSGGKDSVVLYDLALKSGVKFKSYYSATGIDAPEVVKFIRDNYPDIIFKRPKESFFAMVRKKGPPRRSARWCCDHIKKRPTKSVPLKHRLMGIRAEESPQRAKRPNPDYYKPHKEYIYKPMFFWLEWEVWEYIDFNELPYCSLYDEGFRRLGCVVCPFICSLNMKAIEKHRTRWPKHYVAFEKAVKKCWDTKLVLQIREERRATNFDEFLLNWYRGK